MELKNYKVKAEGRNTWLIDKAERLGYKSSKVIRSYQGGYLYFKNKNIYYGDTDVIFEEHPNTEISWQDFPLLSEPNPFEGKEYHVKVSSHEESEYIQLIAFSRGYKPILETNK